MIIIIIICIVNSVTNSLRTEIYFVLNHWPGHITAEKKKKNEQWIK